MTRRRVLSKDQVRAIRSEYKANQRGGGYRELSKKYGVGESTIRDCVKFWTYAWVR